MRIVPLMLLLMVASANAAELPKWSQGTWADNRFTTCRQVNSSNEFRDGGFIYINGGEMSGHEWSCQVVRKVGKGEYDFACGGEGEEFKAHGVLQRNGGGMVIRWSQFGEGNQKNEVWRYSDWCRRGPPAFWGQ